MFLYEYRILRGKRYIIDDWSIMLILDKIEKNGVVLKWCYVFGGLCKNV